jgi:hypothetical protein
MLGVLLFPVLTGTSVTYAADARAPFSGGDGGSLYDPDNLNPDDSTIRACDEELNSIQDIPDCVDAVLSDFDPTDPIGATNILGAVEGIIQTLSGYLGSVSEQLPVKLCTPTIQGQQVCSSFGGNLDDGLDATGDALNQISGALGTIGETLRDLFRIPVEIINTVNQTVGDFVTWVGNTTTGIVNWIEGLTEPIENFADGIINFSENAEFTP